MRHIFLRLTSLVLVVALYGCDSQDSVPSDENAGVPPSSLNPSVSRGNDSPPPSYDDLLYDVAELAPDFAGVFFNSEGQLEVSVRNYEEHVVAGELARVVEDISTALRVVFGQDLQDLGYVENGAGLVPDASPARYSFKDLKDWYDLADAVRGLDGVYISDINEAENELQFGVGDEGVAQNVRSILLDLEIPEDAFDVYLSGMDVPLGGSLPGAASSSLPSSTILGTFRPIVGGIKITRYLASSGDSVTTCTIGFTAQSSQPPSFVTNSHCTAIEGGPDPYNRTRFMGQPTAGSAVGEEVYDPAFSSSVSGCPSGKVCRYSDSALYYAYVSGAIDFGVVANPSLPGTTGTFYLSPSVPYLTITGNASNLAMKSQVWFIGQSSGGVNGVVSATCVASNRNNNRTYLCQNLATTSLIAQRGDSGGPVFQFDPLDNSKIKISGIVSARRVGGKYDDDLVFSRYSHVSNELTAVAY